MSDSAININKSDNLTHRLEPIQLVQDGNHQAPKRDLRFWLQFGSLCIGVFLSALELTAVSTALPTIVNELHGDDFVWVGSAYAIASSAFVPLTGGLSETFGRRIVVLGSIVLFALGSALCGSAQNMPWLIAARAIQGAGGGTILSITSIILADMVPLRDRGVFSAMFNLAWAFAAAIGPIVGGSLTQQGQWRWLFYLNLPISGICLVLCALFINLPIPDGTFGEKIGRIDWIGNLLIISSTCLTALGLSWGGIRYSWRSAHVLVPLILGLCGLALSLLYEAVLARYPLVPYQLLSNRTSLSGYIQAFLFQFVLVALIYYLPVYYQACHGASATGSAVDTFGLAFVISPIGIGLGIFIKKTQKYRTASWVGWILMAIGCGLLSMSHAGTARANVIGYEIVASAGVAVPIVTSFFFVLSALPVSANARALAFYQFQRQFATIWAVTIGGTILQNELRRKLPAGFVTEFHSGVVLAYEVIPEIRSLLEPLKSEVREAFASGLSVLWDVLAGVSVVGFLIALAAKELPLHTYTDRKWDGQQPGSDSVEPDA